MSDRELLKLMLWYIYAEEFKNHIGVGEYPETFLYKMKRKIKYFLGEYVKRRYVKRKCGEKN